MPDQKLESLLAALHLASPALPVGGFAYSQGLEQAVEDAWVTNVDQAFEWIHDVLLLSLARQEIPLWQTAYLLCAADAPDWSELKRLNTTLLALRETAEFRLEALQMGHSMAKLFTQWPRGAQLSSACIDMQWVYPCAHAALAAISGVEQNTALAAYLWSWSENQVLAAVKTVPLGQIDGQLLLHRLKPVIGQAIAIASTIEPQEIGSAALGLAVTSSRHETQYSRLFRS
jgi:urease accessory protein